MYVYDKYDQQLVDERVAQYRNQTQRYLDGDLSESEFLPLRLQNGLYVQRLAPMLRVAVPYGLMNSQQMRMLAQIAREYDKGYAHISTRQNVQFNWPELPDSPDILADLASVQMHAIQTSGNCIRSTTTDQFAGVSADEYLDPRPYCELIRQWSTFHPEFAFLPRKFKIAVCGSDRDRAAIRMHDIGIELVVNDAGEVGYKVIVGGGLGRTPVIGQVINEFLPEAHLLTYLDAILRVYNQQGNRKNKYKARIKILVRTMGVDAFREKVDQEWELLKDGPSTLIQSELDRVKACFTAPEYAALNADDAQMALNAQSAADPAFAAWLKTNTHDHKVPGYKAITISLKRPGVPPGDVTDGEMDAVADLADTYSFGELRTSHQQNLILSDVKMSDLQTVWEALKTLNLAGANAGTLLDMICCPGGDYCALANAKSIPVADALARKFDDMDYIYDLGELELNISGCMNACGHHHVGQIGILGVDKKGKEFFQISLGGYQGKEASLGKILGPSFSAEEIPDVMETILNTYVENRQEEEDFLSAYRRLGHEIFKEAVYAEAN
ncbi:Sulfite reductase [ferredoxin] [BD1-7 clade bacterium]|uniref:Sulfite reductase [ferredoxin] n=1 Tax=BD1-7 clade bacterium TaxID=2029982 RepID=A0A5S9PRF4_9GAMM|nr:Sulfite reductase [ferredoxin] [BD1-7 clade bacterium]